MGENRVDFIRDALGRKIVTARSNGTRDLRFYDASGRVIGEMRQRKTGSFRPLDLGFLNRYQDRPLPAAIEFLQFERELLLTEQTLSAAMAPFFDFDNEHETLWAAFYLYDKNGNRKATLTNETVTFYGYDRSDRLALHQTRIEKTGNENRFASYQHDQNGNLTKEYWHKKVRPNSEEISKSHQYDSLNRLTKIKLSSGVEYQYAYDALDRRIKTSRTGGTMADFESISLFDERREYREYDTEGSVFRQLEWSPNEDGLPYGTLLKQILTNIQNRPELHNPERSPLNTTSCSFIKMY